jgi:hypothetical protein
MKYLLASIVLIAVLCSGTPLITQAQSACSPVTAANVKECCINNTNTTAAETTACEDYYNGSTGTTATPTPTPAAAPDNSCSPITATNNEACCNNNTNTTDSEQFACQAYAINQQKAAGQIGSLAGAPLSTAAVNTSNTSYNGNPAVSGANIAAVNACSAVQLTSLINIAIWVKCIIGAIVIPGIFTLAFVVFLWGVFKFIRSSEQKDKEESKNFIIMGLIGLFVMVSVWGILKILGNTLGIQTVVPTLQTTSLPLPASKNTPTPAPVIVPTRTSIGTN